MTPGKTFIICPIGIGNYLMAQPAIAHLRRFLSKAELHILALKSPIASLSQWNEHIDKTHHWDPDKESISAGIKLLRKLRAERFDNTINLFPTGHIKFSLFSKLVGSHQSYGFDYPHSRAPRAFQSDSHPIDMSQHDCLQNLNFISQLTETPYEIIPPIRHTFHSPEQETPLPTKPYYVCHPGSSTERLMQHKRLPTEAFSQLIDTLYKRHQLTCLLIGGPEEQVIRDAITQTCQHPEACQSFTSQPFASLIPTIRNSHFFLGNDSGLMHLATALNKPTITFFGPTDPLRTGPWILDEQPIENFNYKNHLNGTPHLVVQQRSLDCLPCWKLANIGRNQPCQYGDYRCLQQLDITSHFEAIDQFVEKARSL